MFIEQKVIELVLPINNYAILKLGGEAQFKCIKFFDMGV